MGTPAVSGSAAVRAPVRKAPRRGLASASAAWRRRCWSIGRQWIGGRKCWWHSRRCRGRRRCERRLAGHLGGGWRERRRGDVGRWSIGRQQRISGTTGGASARCGQRVVRRVGSGCCFGEHSGRRFRRSRVCCKANEAGATTTMTGPTAGSAKPVLPCSLRPSACGHDKDHGGGLPKTVSGAPRVIRGTPPAVVRACQNAILSAARPLGAVRVRAASAGTLSRQRGGTLTAPIGCAHRLCKPRRYRGPAGEGQMSPRCCRQGHRSDIGCFCLPSGPRLNSEPNAAPASTIPEGPRWSPGDVDILHIAAARHR